MPSGRQHQQFVARDSLAQWCPHGLPIRKQFIHGAGIHDGARQDMRARLRAFFNHHHRYLFVGLCGQLFDANGGGQSSRPSTNHYHVVFHGIARAELFKQG